MAKIRDLTLLSDILPDRLSRRGDGGRDDGIDRLRRWSGGPVGLACAAACHLLGAAVVIVGDMIPERLAQARSFGCETVDLKKTRRWKIRSSRSSACRKWTAPWTASVLKRTGMERTRHRAAGDGAELGDGVDAGGRRASASPACTSPTIRAAPTPTPRSACSGSASAWDGQSRISFVTGQCPVMRYHRQLMQAILYDKIQIAKAVNVQRFRSKRRRKATATSTRARRRSSSSTRTG